jgi:23S rRNA (uridine2552-2'-O)-methyltransferase
LTRCSVRPPVILDLGAAPGGWSQVLANKLGVRPLHIAEEHEESLDFGRLHFAEIETETETEENGSSLVSSTESGYIDIQARSKTFGEWGNWNVPLPHEKQSSAKPIIIALDLLEMLPIIGVQSLQLSFLDSQAESIITGMVPIRNTGSKKRPEIDLILSDMSPEITGNRIRDTEVSMELCERVFDFSTRYLRSHMKGRGHGLELGGALV